MIRLITIFIVICTGILTQSYGQAFIHTKIAPKDLLKEFEAAKKDINANNNLDALKKLSKILSKEPRFINAYYELAYCQQALKLPKDAIKSYNAALKLDTMYQTMVLNQLGVLYTDLGEWDNALYAYQRFIANAKSNSKTVDSAKIQIARLNFIKYSIAHPVPFNPINLGPNINTEANENFPCLTADGEKLIFSRIIDQEDFYESDIIDGQLEIPQPLTAINTPLNEGAQAISGDGQVLVFTACNYSDSYGRCDLYISRKGSEGWSKPKNMGAVVNSPQWDSQPSLSADGKTLYFASNRSLGAGQTDIYKSEYIDNRWSKPELLPRPINGTFNSATPFIHADNTTLYFQADSFQNLGGFDLFMSKKKPKGGWTDPVNLGYPINSVGDEASLIVSADGKTAYYSSTMENQKSTKNYGKLDIYSFELPLVLRPTPVTYAKIQITDISSGRALAGNYVVEDLKTSKIFTQGRSNAEGKALICLPSGSEYSLRISAEGYSFYSDNFKLDSINNIYRPYLLKAELLKMNQLLESKTESAPFVLKNVFFETGMANLNPASQSELNFLSDMLNKYPNMKIQINGHTDNVGNDKDNFDLSTSRAKAVYDFLINKGINVERLKYKGFGMTKSIADNATPEGRQKNRRTEFQIIK